MDEEQVALDPQLRVISDSFMEQLEGLLALEERKRTTPVDDPGFPALARDVEAAARALLDRAGEQTARAHELHDRAVDEGSSATIEDIPADLPAVRILAMWRDADHELADTQLGTSRHRELTDRVDALRSAYQRAFLRGS